MTTLRSFMLDTARNPFLAQEFHATPEAVLDQYNLAEQGRAALIAGEAAAIQRALAAQVSAIANPWIAEQVPATGVGVLLWPGFLNHDECRVLHAEMAAAARVDAPVGQIAREGSEVSVNRQARRTSNLQVADSTMHALVDRIASVAPVINRHFNTVTSECEQPQFLCYEPAGLFDAHCDNTGDPRQPAYAKRRRITVLLFVNDCVDALHEEQAGNHQPTYSGGHLRLFRRGPDSPAWSLAGQRGLLVAFRSSAWHQVTPVITGERYSVVSWLLDPAMPAAAGTPVKTRSVAGGPGDLQTTERPSVPSGRRQGNSDIRGQQQGIAAPSSEHGNGRGRAWADRTNC